jgi:hypothetical protein
VKDPIVNIYPDTTTYINWTWNYDSTQIDADKILKDVKVPVWNKPVDNRRAESSVPAKNGSLSANALFAEPTWDEEKTYMFTVEVSDSTSPTVVEPINYSASIPASELEFINCTYDEIGDLWVLSGTSETKYFSEGSYYFCYVLRNLSSSENEEYEFTCSSRLSQDFAVATVGEQNDQNKQKYLFYITVDDTGSKNNIKSFKIEGEGGDLENGTQHFTFGQISAIYAKDNNLYIAVTENGNCTTANIYTGTISINETNNSPKELLSLGISDFTNETILNSDFYNSAFAISDMYINEDKSKLYVTAGCVCYHTKAWIFFNENDYWEPHSFGGLFVYDITEDDSLELSGKYGIYEGNDENNPFLKEAKPGEGIFELESNIMQAENEDSRYFAGPRYIIPAGKDLLIVDSGFYGVYKDPNTPLTDCEKRNRIFTYNIIENELSFNSITKVDDSISFDYDYLVNSDKIE